MLAPHLSQYDAVAAFWAPHFEQKTEFSGITSDYNSPSRHTANPLRENCLTTDDTDEPLIALINAGQKRKALSFISVICAISVITGEAGEPPRHSSHFAGNPRAPVPARRNPDAGSFPL
jgi:hypothetical protein